MTRTRDVAPAVELRCTVVDARTCADHDVAIVGPRGTTLGDVLTLIADAGSGPSLPEAVSASVGGLRIDPGHPLGSPPLLHGCLLVMGGLADPPAAGSPALQLDVVAGPDAGRSLPLPPGEHVIGRDAPAALRLDDPEVSRRHARVTVTSTGVFAQDLGSTNGTWRLQGGAATESAQAIDDDPRAVVVGGRLRVGGSALELRVPAGRPGSTRPTGTGYLEVNRPPRHHARMAPLTLTSPSPPQSPARAGVPWVGMAVPLVLCLVAAWFLRQPSYLLFGLMSPLVLAGTAVGERLGRGRRRRREEDQWQEQGRALDRKAALAMAEERAVLRSTVGDPVSVARMAQLPGSRLWERTTRCPDLLLVSVGTGEVPSARVRWSSPDDETGRPATGKPPSTWSAAPLVLRDAPVTVNLTQHVHLGLCGDRAMALRVTRWVLGQLATWHAPEVVQLLVVSGSPEDWRWTRWLPHRLAPAGASSSDLSAQLDELVRGRRQQVDDRGWRGHHLVVLVDGSAAARLPGTVAAMAHGAEVGVHVLCLAENQAALPAGCEAVVVVGAAGEAVLRRSGEDIGLVVDGARGAWAETLARTLAPLRDATPVTGRLPAEVALLPLLAVDPTDAPSLAALWHRTPRTTRAVIGRGIDGPVEVDLAADGPHVLVAGTTGSGKSELLRTLVTSLAVGNRPDELAFVLVDYKGGAAFRGCADLPHTVGLVTDLDAELARRALDSFDSELRRRERLLHDAGCRDVAEYQSQRDRDVDLPPVPRLVLVIDEFRVLASELPEFLDGVVRVASVGRSLGVHVVLATQRPGGVVTADIKANVNLRICLRVRGQADSDDVLDAPDAAAISPDSPGQALLRRAGDSLVPLQVARVDDGPPTAARLQLRRVDRDDWSGPASAPGSTPDGATPARLQRVVAACQDATSQLAITPPTPVWWPPLSDRLPLSLLETTDHHLSDGSAVVGLLDLPAQQHQGVVGWHPVDSGHLAVAGASRTGRTTTLLTIVAGLARAWSPGDLHLHVIDAGLGALSALAGLPHTGSVLSTREPRQVARLIDRLTVETARRRVSGRASAGPALVVLVDGWEPLCEALSDVDHGRPVDALLSLMRDGESVGLRVLVTGGRGVLLSRVATLVAQRLLLRPNDPTDLLLAGVNASALPSRQVPGRAVRAEDGAQVQVALAPSADELLLDVGRRWPAWREVPDDRRAMRLRELPLEVEAGTLDVRHRAPTWALVGCGDDDASAVGIDLAVDPFALVAGPPGSGRSTALATMARSLHDKGAAVLAVCPRRSALSAGPWTVLAPTDVGPTTGELLGRHDVLLVDDVEQLRDHPLEALLCAVAQASERGLVVAGATDALLGTLRGLGSYGRGRRTGVLLQPTSPSDGEVLGVRAELDDHPPAGRGVLVVRGIQSPVQVAL